MVILTLFRLVFKNNLGDPCACTKMVRLGGFGYHGNLLAFLVFGFWCVVCQVLYVGIPLRFGMSQCFDISGTNTNKKMIWIQNCVYLSFGSVSHGRVQGIIEGISNML